MFFGKLLFAFLSAGYCVVRLIAHFNDELAKLFVLDAFIIKHAQLLIHLVLHALLHCADQHIPLLLASKCVKNVHDAAQNWTSSWLD